jgi:hypothetical protein
LEATWRKVADLVDLPVEDGVAGHRADNPPVDNHLVDNPPAGCGDKCLSSQHLEDIPSRGHPSKQALRGSRSREATQGSRSREATLSLPPSLRGGIPPNRAVILRHHSSPAAIHRSNPAAIRSSNLRSLRQAHGELPPRPAVLSVRQRRGWGAHPPDSLAGLVGPVDLAPRLPLERRLDNSGTKDSEALSSNRALLGFRNKRSLAERSGVWCLASPSSEAFSTTACACPSGSGLGWR